MFNEFFGTMPIQGSDVATQFDYLYAFLLGISFFFFVLCMGGMAYFAWAYRKGAGHRTSSLEDHTPLEIIWTAIPTVLVLFIFAWGWVVYKKQIGVPPDAYEIRVIGKQWLWQFQYDNGVSTIGDLYVPQNKPVRLVMTSQDVIHAFFIPNFRVKQDVVPGMYTQVWFEAAVTGEHQVYCSEYCGVSHSGMLAKVIVLDEEDWNRWLAGKKLVNYKPNIPAGKTAMVEHGGKPKGDSKKPLSLVEQGKRLTRAKGCVACHTANGNRLIGPSYKGRFGTKVELSDGTTAVVDENYVRESILNPNSKIVKGFAAGQMPVFKGLVTEPELNALIAYIKSLQ